MKDSFVANESFYSLPFYVDRRVLIPKNPTEVLVDKALQYIKKSPSQHFTLIDVGTGSACIPIALCKNTPKISQGFALDISPDALEVAKINISYHHLEDKILLKKSDLFSYFFEEKIKITTPLIITANLPYIQDGDFEHMDKEVIENEPHQALFGGPNSGFELYEKFFEQLMELKEASFTNSIQIFIEIGFDQYDIALQYLSPIFKGVEIYKDFSGIERVCEVGWE